MKTTPEFTVLLISAALFIFSCQQDPAGSGNNEVTPPAVEEDDEEDVVEVEDPTLMTIANFENSFLTFHEGGGNNKYSIVTNPRKKGVNTSRR